MPPKKALGKKSAEAAGGGSAMDDSDYESLNVGDSIAHVPTDLGDFYERRNELMEEMLNTVQTHKKIKKFKLLEEERERTLKTLQISEAQIQELRLRNARRNKKIAEIAKRNDSEVATEVIQLAMHAIESIDIVEQSDRVVTSLLGFCVAFTADQLTYRATSISLSGLVYNVLTALVEHSMTFATNKVTLELALYSTVVADCAGYDISRRLLEHFNIGLKHIGGTVNYVRGNADNIIEYYRSNDTKEIVRDVLSITCYTFNRIRLSSIRLLFNIKEKILDLSRKIKATELLRLINKEAASEDEKMGVVDTSDTSSVTSSIKRSSEYKKLQQKAKLDSTTGKSKKTHGKKTHVRKSSKVYKNKQTFDTNKANTQLTFDTDKAIEIADSIIKQTEEHIEKQNTEVGLGSQLTPDSSEYGDSPNSSESGYSAGSSHKSSPDNMNVAGGGGR